MCSIPSKLAFDVHLMLLRRLAGALKTVPVTAAIWGPPLSTNYYHTKEYIAHSCSDIVVYLYNLRRREVRCWPLS